MLVVKLLIEDCVSKPGKLPVRAVLTHHLCITYMKVVILLQFGVGELKETENGNGNNKK
jgi:hypothetical protein